MSLPQVINPRLLLALSSSRSLLFCSSSSRSFSSYLCSTSSFRVRSPLEVAVPSCRRGGGGRLFPRRKFTGGERSTIAEERKGGKENRKTIDMAGAEGTVGFNKKRAEGRDGVQKKNLQLKVRKLNPINTICYVQILGTGMDTQDTSPSVLLFFDQQRIIFNAGEGLQRFCTEHKIKLSKIDHIFLTRVCSETAGGLPGLLLTMAGIGEEGMSVNVWGPSELNYLVGAMKSFIPHAAMVNTHSFGETIETGDAILSTDPIVLIDDKVVKVSAILLGRCSSDESNFDEGNAHTNAPFGSSQYMVGRDLKPGDVAVIYVCELPEIQGKFDPSKAAALGLKPGPKYRELQLGKSVMSDTQGVIVHPSDVLGPSIPGPIVLLVDCPTMSHLRDLFSLQTLSSYYTNSTDHLQGAKSVNCIIHLGPASVTKNADYRIWMSRFGDAKHIMAGHEIKNTKIPILRSSTRITSRLNYLCPQLFPSPGLGSIEEIINSNPKFESSTEDDPSASEIIFAENLMKFHLRPYSLLGLDKSAIPSYVPPAEIVDELLSEIPEVTNAAKDVTRIWEDYRNVKGSTYLVPEYTDMVEEPWVNEPAMVHVPDIGNTQSHLTCISETEHDSYIPCCLEGIPRDDMEIVLLGTGSSQPSKYRNVSSIYLNLFEKGSVLLDCGEGTLAQLKRRFGVEGADNAVKSLRFIWISHIHADHHVGITNILALRCKLLKGVSHDPLLVIGPRPLKRFLDAYSRLEDLDVEFLDCRHTTEASWETLAGSHQAINKCSHEDFVKNDVKIANTETAPQKLVNTVFGKFSQMQSYLKQPGSPVDISAVLPLLTKLRGVLQDAGLECLYSVPVVHCPQAFAIVVKASERSNNIGKIIPGWKLVYSGDTRPCQALIDASQGATVLIHEATFEDGMEAEAIAKNHSTAMEAIEVGTSAGAYRIILTHFSQRYPKIPVFDESHMHNTCIAFDMMSVNLADLPVLPKVLPYLKLLFKNEMARDESEDMPVLVSSG